MKKVNLELGHNKKIFLVSPNITLDELFSYFRPFYGGQKHIYSGTNNAHDIHNITFCFYDFLKTDINTSPMIMTGRTCTVPPLEKTRPAAVRTSG